MQHTRVNETQAYVISMTRYICSGDVWVAILAVLFELGLHTSMDGFLYLRRAIMIRYENPDIRMADIYRKIVERYDSATSVNQVDQAIYSIIGTAWNNRNEEIWDCFFPEEILGKSRRPTNKEFISQISCFMELWCSYCRKGEVRYGAE